MNACVKVTGVPTDISFAVSKNVLAVSTYNGTLEIVDPEKKESKVSLDFGDDPRNRHEYTICRALEFCQDGSDRLITAMNDENSSVIIYDLEGLKHVRKISSGCESMPCSILIVNENLFAIGGDDGHVTLWDVRGRKKVTSARPGSDAVSKMTLSPDGESIICALFEGRLGTVKIRGGNVFRSEEYKYAFNTVGTFRQNTKLAVGDDSGQLYFFDIEKLSYHSDMYRGHKSPINAMVPITETIGLLGFEDGSLRAFNFFPHKPVGVVGEHPSMVLHMDVSSDGRTLSSSAHDEEVRFWDVGHLEYAASESNSKSSDSKKRSKARHNLPSSNQQNPADFFSGMEIQSEKSQTEEKLE